MSAPNFTTRRHPRTLTEAFGPYTDGHICEADDGVTAAGHAVAAWCAAVILALLCIALMVGAL